MTADLYPLQVLLVTLAGWVNRHQQHVVEYLVEENRVLKEQVKGRRLPLTDDHRRRLAARVADSVAGSLRHVATIVTRGGGPRRILGAVTEPPPGRPVPAA